MNEQAINFLRFLSATAYALFQEQVAQGVFQRPWARLIPEERQAVINQGLAHLGDILRALTPENVAALMQQAVAAQERPVGFQPQGAPPPGPPAAPDQSPTPPGPPPRIPEPTGGPQQP